MRCTHRKETATMSQSSSHDCYLLHFHDTDLEICSCRCLTRSASSSFTSKNTQDFHVAKRIPSRGVSRVAGKTAHYFFLSNSGRRHLRGYCKVAAEMPESSPNTTRQLSGSPVLRTYPCVPWFGHDQTTVGNQQVYTLKDRCDERVHQQVDRPFLRQR
jgi:hypothetical protein